MDSLSSCCEEEHKGEQWATGAGYVAVEVLYFVLSNDPLCILSSPRSAKGRVWEFHSALPIFLMAVMAGTRIRAMAMAIASASLIEIFFFQYCQAF